MEYHRDLTRFPLGDRRNFVLQQTMMDCELILYEDETDEISRQIVLSYHNWNMLSNIINKISECFDEICKNKEAEMSFHLGYGIYVKLCSPYMVVHIRKYYWTKDNLFLPTSTGVSMRYDEFRDLKAAMNEINPDLKLDLTE
jgi:hypothetical protein